MTHIRPSKTIEELREMNNRLSNSTIDIVFYMRRQSEFIDALLDKIEAMEQHQNHSIHWNK